METKTQGHNPTIRLRAGLSVSHLRTASRFASVAAEVEDQHREHELCYEGFFHELQDHVVSCVLLSVASLEANINEVLADDDWIPEAVHHVREMIADLLDDKPILKKYQSVMRLKGIEPLDEGVDPFQSAKALVDLRNALVHFKPEWDNEQKGCQVHTFVYSQSTRPPNVQICEPGTDFMPRKPRLFVPEATYHVYCRVARGEFVFDEPFEADCFVETVRKVGELHRWKVLAWCLMGNHYHLVVKTSSIPLWRTMQRLQCNVAREFNRRRKYLGRLWHIGAR